MAERRQRCLVVAALAATALALPAPAQAAPTSTPALHAWLNTTSPTTQRRPAPRVRQRQKRGRAGRGRDDAHAAPLALTGYDDLWPRGRDRVGFAALR